LVARTLFSSLHRPADILARYGGEEFIALLPNTNVQGARTVAETLRTAIQALDIPHAHSSTGAAVTISIGGAVTERTTGLNEQDLCRDADAALYKAKAQGRNRTVIVQIPPHKTVLIVDGDSESARHASGLLGQRFNIITAASVEECLEITTAIPI
jgi:predicted signal transduction protein with EAL and GGDEF domain